jgi:uncharacterized protein
MIEEWQTQAEQTPPPGAPPRLRGRWRRIVLHLLGREDPPEKVAAAFALGVAIGFSPLIGFHTVIALGLAFLLGLSKIDVLLGTFVVNPWTMVPIYAFASWIGARVLRISPGFRPRLPWREIMHRSFWTTIRTRGLHNFDTWFVGCLVLSTVSAALTYFLVKAVILRYEKTHPHLSARKRRETTPVPDR